MIVKDRLQNILDSISFNEKFLANVSISTEIKNPSDVRTQCIPDDSLPFEISIALKDKDSGKPGYLCLLASVKAESLRDMDIPNNRFYSDIFYLIIRMFSHETQENFLINNKVYCEPHTDEFFRPCLVLVREHLIRFVEA